MLALVLVEARHESISRVTRLARKSGYPLLASLLRLEGGSIP